MFAFTVKSDLHILQFNLSVIDKIMFSQVHSFMRKKTQAVHDKAIELMKEPKTGRFYPYLGKQIQASAKGEAPAIRSGKLRDSLYNDTHASFYEITGRVATNSPYAPYLENKDGLDRMFLAPALAHEADGFADALYSIVNKVCRSV